MFTSIDLLLELREKNSRLHKNAALNQVPRARVYIFNPPPHSHHRHHHPLHHLLRPNQSRKNPLSPSLSPSRSPTETPHSPPTAPDYHHARNKKTSLPSTPAAVYWVSSRACWWNYWRCGASKKRARAKAWTSTAVCREWRAWKKKTRRPMEAAPSCYF